MLSRAWASSALAMRPRSAQLRSAVRRVAITAAEGREVFGRSQLPHRPEAAEACVRRRRAFSSRPKHQRGLAESQQAPARSYFCSARKAGVSSSRSASLSKIVRTSSEVGFVPGLCGSWRSGSRPTGHSDHLPLCDRHNLVGANVDRDAGEIGPVLEALRSVARPWSEHGRPARGR
jgi:hypothetical protein